MTQKKTARKKRATRKAAESTSCGFRVIPSHKVKYTDRDGNDAETEFRTIGPSGKMQVKPKGSIFTGKWTLVGEITLPTGKKVYILLSDLVSRLKVDGTPVVDPSNARGKPGFGDDGVEIPGLRIADLLGSDSCENLSEYLQTFSSEYATKVSSAKVEHARIAKERLAS